MILCLYFSIRISFAWSSNASSLYRFSSFEAFFSRGFKVAFLAPLCWSVSLTGTACLRKFSSWQEFLSKHVLVNNGFLQYVPVCWVFLISHSWFFNSELVCCFSFTIWLRKLVASLVSFSFVPNISSTASKTDAILFLFVFASSFCWSLASFAIFLRMNFRCLSFCLFNFLSNLNFCVASFLFNIISFLFCLTRKFCSLIFEFFAKISSSWIGLLFTLESMAASVSPFLWSSVCFINKCNCSSYCSFDNWSPCSVSVSSLKALNGSFR